MKSTFRKMLPLLALAFIVLSIPAVAGVTTWNQKVFQVEVKEPIQVRLIEGPETTVVWPGQCLRYVYEISNVGPMPYKIEIGGALNGWENGQRKSWLGTSAPKVTVSYSLETTQTPGIEPPVMTFEGSLTFDIPAHSTYYVTIYIYFHEDIEAGDWSFYLSVVRIPFEGKG